MNINMGTPSIRMIKCKRHREDGPAIEYVNGLGSYYLNGYNFKEEPYKKEMMKRRLKDLIQ